VSPIVTYGCTARRWIRIVLDRTAAPEPYVAPQNRSWTIGSASAADQQAGKEPRPRFAPDIRSRAVLRNGPLSSARRHHLRSL